MLGKNRPLNILIFLVILMLMLSAGAFAKPQEKKKTSGKVSSLIQNQSAKVKAFLRTVETSRDHAQICTAYKNGNFSDSEKMQIRIAFHQSKYSRILQDSMNAARSKTNQKKSQADQRMKLSFQQKQNALAQIRRSKINKVNNQVMKAKAAIVRPKSDPPPKVTLKSLSTLPDGRCACEQPCGPGRVQTCGFSM